MIRARKAAEDLVTAIYAKHAAKGSLHSGGTIHSVVTALEEAAAEFITRCVDQVAPVAKDTEAFAKIRETVERFLSFLASKIDDAAQKAGGANNPGMTKAARDLCKESQASLRRQLEIHRFTFTVPQRSSVPLGSPAIEAQKNRGGKPLAAHWDDMWAAIAVTLYSGDLKPRTQADIERAMKDSLAAKGIDASDSMVRSRARRLWQKLKDSD